MVEMIDITPEGAKTPEGIKRINAVLEDIHETNAKCANLLREFYESYGNQDISSYFCDEIAAALKHRSDLSEELVRAVAGRPAL